MKISLNWLKDFIAINIPVDQVSEILTDIGLEVEKVSEVESVKGGLKGLVIGEVLTVEKHPDADRLNITTVNIGQENPSQIVCGAPNVAVGQKVVVATPGCNLYPSGGEEFKIKSSKIRGVESHGMICAEDEIGLGSSHDGIMILDAKAEIGIAASKYFDLANDIVFEIGLTPNRADAMSHFGVARDLMVAFKHKGILPQDSKTCIHSINDFKADTTDLPIEVVVENKEACPRYAGVSITNITVKDSPDWIKNRLNAIGVRPINNVVDITNYVLHELGQPLHAFDASVVGNKVVVKNLPEGTKFTTLDDEERQLSSEDLMICNESEGMCIAGVFGGSSSGVTEKTTAVFLESAYFNPVSVRKTAKRHGLNTDASFRFERGIDPELTLHALKRAALLIQEIAGGVISSEVVDVVNKKMKPFEFEVSLNRINQLIGVNIEVSVIKGILENLEIEVLKEEGDKLLLEVPTYRVDVQREADIAEEILRIYGFNNIPLPEKLNTSITSREKIDLEQVQHQISDLLVAKGFNEAMSNSLTKSAFLTIQETSSAQERFNVKILNPLSNDLDVMRQTLLFGGLEGLKRNQNYGSENVKFFEFGKTYQKFESGYYEQKFLSLFMMGSDEPESWNQQKGDVSFYTLKGIVEVILNKLGIMKNYSYKAVKNEFFSDGQAIVIAKKLVVNFGWVSKKLQNHFDLKSKVFYAEINWDAVVELLKMNKVKFKEISKFPAVTRDLSLLIDKEVTFGELLETSTSSERKLLKEVSLFDVYEGDKLPENKKSYALRFILQDENKTLKEKDIDGVMMRIQKALETKHNAQLR